MSNSNNNNNNNPIKNNNLFSGKEEKFQFEHKNNSAKAKKERKKARKTLKRERRLNRERRVRDSMPIPPFVRSGKPGISSFLNSRNARALASTSKAMRGVAPYNNRVPPANRPITSAGRERRTKKSIPLPKHVRSGITSYLKPNNLQSLEATGKTFGNTVSHNTTRGRKRAARARQPVTMTELAARGNVEAKRDFRPFQRSWCENGYHTPSDVSLGRYVDDGEWEGGLYARLKQTEGLDKMKRIDLDEATLFSRGYRPVPGRRHKPGNTPLQSAVSNAEEAVHRNPQYYRRPLLRQSAVEEEILSNKNLHRGRMEHPLASIERFRMPNASGNGASGGETKSSRGRKNNNKKNKNKKNNNKKNNNKKNNNKKNNNKKTKNRKKNGGRKTRKHRKK